MTDTTKKQAPEEGLRLAQEVGEKLKGNSLLMGTAESCTGGGIASLLTEIPGSSQWFAGALVTYSNEWKRELLGVREATLEAHGAVSRQVVAEMLDGLLGRFRVQAGLAVSGIAGPGGAVPGKPVGTVIIGAAYKQERRIEECHFSGGRAEVRRKSVLKALSMMQALLTEKAANSL
jgi:nicotinamide-nucleotide amidase